MGIVELIAGSFLAIVFISSLVIGQDEIAEKHEQPMKEMPSSLVTSNSNTDYTLPTYKKKYQYNCPNCGAVVTGNVCEYCGTHFDL